MPPIVGLADNRDYERVMGYAGFQHTTAVSAERYFSFLRSQYAVVDPGWFRSGYHSSETLLAFAARWLHLAFSRDAALRPSPARRDSCRSCFFWRSAGLIRACRDLAPPAQALVAALLVFVFTDVGYAAPFNSFYSQTASLLFLLLTAAIAAEAVRRGRLSGPWLFAYFGDGASLRRLEASGEARGAAAGPLRPAPGGRDLVGARGGGRPSWLGIGLCAFSVWYGRHTPHTLREATLFQFVFDDLLVSLAPRRPPTPPSFASIPSG